ncbi:hypothetical protein E2C01_031751 [Portunus trituberculatus]|uniref:Uncharacterized protein n=1 Tax=Portunus trituberculatus TaxID=210409 RepID=A0A5B7F0X4_PORTR|nr:hypothetical protein [Portunus trituberculatus]
MPHQHTPAAHSSAYPCRAAGRPQAPWSPAGESGVTSGPIRVAAVLLLVTRTLPDCCQEYMMERWINVWSQLNQRQKCDAAAPPTPFHFAPPRPTPPCPA